MGLLPPFPFPPTHDVEGAGARDERHGAVVDV